MPVVDLCNPTVGLLHLRRPEIGSGDRLVNRTRFHSLAASSYLTHSTIRAATLAICPTRSFSSHFDLRQACVKHIASVSQDQSQTKQKKGAWERLHLSIIHTNLNDRTRTQ